MDVSSYECILHLYISRYFIHHKTKTPNANRYALIQDKTTSLIILLESKDHKRHKPAIAKPINPTMLESNAALSAAAVTTVDGAARVEVAVLLTTIIGLDVVVDNVAGAIGRN